MGNMAGSIISSVIGAGASLYAAHEQKKAQEAAQAKAIEAQKAAAAEADRVAQAATKRAEDKAKAERIRLADAARPVGESANIRFGSQNGTELGSTDDFLVPVNVGSSSLGTQGTQTGGLGFA